MGKDLQLQRGLLGLQKLLLKGFLPALADVGGKRSEQTAVNLLVGQNIAVFILQFLKGDKRLLLKDGHQQGGVLGIKLCLGRGQSLLFFGHGQPPCKKIL